MQQPPGPPPSGPSFVPPGAPQGFRPGPPPSAPSPGPAPRGPMGPTGPMPWGPPPPQPKRSRTGLVVALVLTALVIIAVPVGHHFYSQHVERERQEQARIAAQQAAEETRRRATAMATQFVEHIAQGEASQAFAMMDRSRPIARWTLPDEVYAKALESTPITEIGVDQVEGRAGIHEVTVRFLLGNEPQSSTLTVRQKSADEWRIDHDFPWLFVDVPYDLRADLNGHAVTGYEQMVALPGTYALHIASPLVESPSQSVRIPLGDRSQNFRLTLDPRLTTKGRQMIRDALARQIRDCVAQRSFTPRGCPWELTPAPGQRIAESSVRYAVRESRWLEEATITWSGRVPHAAEIYFSLPLHATAQGTEHGRPTTWDHDLTVRSRYTVDVSGETPKLLTGR